MSHTKRSSSPDPITLPSSPLASRSARRSSTTNPLTPRSSHVNSSPSKSFVLETGEARDASPWRIKVTIEAERKDVSSPSKGKSRTRKVPLKGAGSSSPVKSLDTRNAASNHDDAEIGVKPPMRKRRGTPLKRRPTVQETQLESVRGNVEAVAAASNWSHAKRPSGNRVGKRRSLQQMSTEPSPRLTQARQELDQALQDAVGNEVHDAVTCDAPGDATVTENEDFTMVSVESLQSYKTVNNSQLQTTGEGNNSAVNVSYMPSSPPLVRYPDLSTRLAETTRSPAATYDPRSWRPTGGDRNASLAQPTPVQSAGPQHRRPIEQFESEKPGKQIDHSATSKMAGVRDDSSPAQDDGDPEADIWQDEASRSLQAESDQQEELRHHIQHNQSKSTGSKDMNDLFLEQPLKPRRSKIPRIWRRASGNDFAYSDSPAHEALQPRKRSDGSTDRSSGVLTPPSTDDEAIKPQAAEEPSELTHPDAAATQLQDERQAPVAVPEEELRNIVTSFDTGEEVLNLQSDSSNSVTSPEGDDTGLFWQSNMPQVYRRERQRPRPQRMRAMDLTELLNLHSSQVKATLIGATDGHSEGMKSTSRALRSERQHHSPLQMRVVNGKIKSSPSDVGKTRVVSSPLRKSLLKSSKLRGSPLSKTSATRLHIACPQDDSAAEVDEDEETNENIDESFDSKASDERQLLSEMAGTDDEHLKLGMSLDNNDLAEQVSAYDDVDEGDIEEEEDDDEDEEKPEEDSEDVEASRSYEEHLNLDSPQKVRVNFNDSVGNSSLLTPTRKYASLFTDSAPARQISPPSVTLVAKKATLPTLDQPGIFSRLTANFWSAVVRPTGPTEIMPKHADTPVFPPALRAHIRSRYGVLTDQHPWTMLHMRTLHRMLNSCTSNRSDSIIPKSGPLPTKLVQMMEKTQLSMTGFKYAFTTQHAYVVHSLMQILVPASVIDAMEKGEIEPLGDATAREYKELIAGRHGRDLVWPGFAVPMKGAISVEFVVKAVGDVVRANVGTAERARRDGKKLAKECHSADEENGDWQSEEGDVVDSDVLH